MHLVPGNHDRYTRERRIDEEWARWLPEEGFPALRTLPGGTPLLLLDTARPRPLTSRGALSPASCERVGELLDGLPPGPAIVLTHYPVLPRTATWRLGPSRRLEGAERLRAVLGHCDRKILFLAGHVHRFASLRDERHPTLHHATAPAFHGIDRRSGNRGGFLEVFREGEQGWLVHHYRQERWHRTERLRWCGG